MSRISKKRKQLCWREGIFKMLAPGVKLIKPSLLRGVINITISMSSVFARGAERYARSAGSGGRNFRQRAVCHLSLLHVSMTNGCVAFAELIPLDTDGRPCFFIMA